MTNKGSLGRRLGCRALVVLLCLLPPAMAAARERAVPLGFEQRRNALLDAFAAAPWPRPECAEEVGDGACIWGKTTLAFVRLFRASGGEAPADAVALLREAVRQVGRGMQQRELTASDDLDQAADSVATRRFHFLTAALLFRAARQFGGDSGSAAVRLPEAVQAEIREVFWAWAQKECLIADTDLAMVWRPWGSENHDVQRVHACWAAAELLAGSAQTRDRRFQDGSTAMAQRTFWTTYIKAFSKRARSPVSRLRSSPRSIRSIS
jgi:hypothetical protein